MSTVVLVWLGSSYAQISMQSFSFCPSCISRNDPVRAFISGQVANSMASEVIALLHGLLTATTAEIWTSAVAKVLGDALAALPQVLKQIDAIGASTLGQVTLLHMARRVVAALCALGGFQSTLKPGSEITILGVGSSSTSGLVVNISEQQDMATVKLNAPSACYSQWQQQHENSCGPTFQVPLSRLIPKQIEVAQLFLCVDPLGCWILC